MKCKVFTGRRWDTAEKRAYGWLAMQKPQVELHCCETHWRGPATVKVWYDFARSRPTPPARAAREAGTSQRCQRAR